MIQIDKNIEIPGAEYNSKYPLRNMECGDSFFVPGKTVSAISGSTSRYRKKGWKFVCRTVTENGVEGVRVWRTQ